MEEQHKALVSNVQKLFPAALISKSETQTQPRTQAHFTDV